MVGPEAAEQGAYETEQAGETDHSVDHALERLSRRQVERLRQEPVAVQRDLAELMDGSVSDARSCLRGRFAAYKQGCPPRWHGVRGRRDQRGLCGGDVG